MDHPHTAGAPAPGQEQLITSNPSFTEEMVDVTAEAATYEIGGRVFSAGASALVEKLLARSGAEATSTAIKAGSFFLSEDTLKIVVEQGTHNPESKEVMIGLFKGGRGYTDPLINKGRTFLDLGGDTYKDFFVGSQKFDWWQVNQRFLDDQIKLGKTFNLETSYKEALKAFAKDGKTGEGFINEIKYLLEKGYKWLDDMTLVPGEIP